MTHRLRLTSILVPLAVLLLCCSPETEEKKTLATEERKTYYEHGALKEEYSVIPGDPEIRIGKYVRWYDTGVKAEEGLYVDGKREGKWVWPTLADSGYYRQGKKHGTWVENFSVYRGEECLAEGKYADDRKVGEWMVKCWGVPLGSGFTCSTFVFKEGQTLSATRCDEGEYEVYEKHASETRETIGKFLASMDTSMDSSTLANLPVKRVISLREYLGL